MNRRFRGEAHIGQTILMEAPTNSRPYPAVASSGRGAVRRHDPFALKIPANHMRPLKCLCSADARGTNQSRSLPHLRLVQLHALRVA